VSRADRPRLLILRPLGLGDLLTALPALRALKASFPGHQRILAAPKRLAGLAGITGTVDVVVPAGPLEPLPESLSRVEVAVNLHGRGPQSHRIILDLRPGRLICFEHAEVPESLGSPSWRRDEHEVDRWCRLLQESGIPADTSRLELAPPLLTALADRGATLLHPGAASEARRWPIERWAQVARHEAGSGRRVIITGDSSERALCLSVAQLAGLPPSCVYAGLTDLTELASLVAGAGRLVAGDTGVAHIATAVGTPSVLLFGPTSPALWGPPSNRPAHRVIWKGRSGDPHGTSPDPGLVAITVEEVLEALATLPAKGSSLNHPAVWVTTGPGS
jgi:ADP-heptose:LPS heptosyltransferase